MHKAVYEAREAIGRRRLIHVNATDDVALTAAEVGLQMLIEEGSAKYV
jgi:hypothetical protein